MTRATITRTRTAGEDHAVHTVEGGGFVYRRQPCAECPWRVENTGNFPAEAFEHSADTARDSSFSTFACHMSGSEKPAVCAGFLLRNSVHNLGVRMAIIRGDCDPRQVSEGGAVLFDSYRLMAETNGVDPESPALAMCRADDE